MNRTIAYLLKMFNIYVALDSHYEQCLLSCVAVVVIGNARWGFEALFECFSLSFNILMSLLSNTNKVPQKQPYEPNCVLSRLNLAI